MKPKTIDECLDWHFGKHPDYDESERLSDLPWDELKKECEAKILDLVSKAIQENRHGFGLTVAEGEQLAKRVKVALT